MSASSDEKLPMLQGIVEELRQVDGLRLPAVWASFVLACTCSPRKLKAHNSESRCPSFMASTCYLLSKTKLALQRSAFFVVQVSSKHPEIERPPSPLLHLSHRQINTAALAGAAAKDVSILQQF